MRLLLTLVLIFGTGCAGLSDTAKDIAVEAASKAWVEHGEALKAKIMVELTAFVTDFWTREGARLSDSFIASLEEALRRWWHQHVGDIQRTAAAETRR